MLDFFTNIIEEICFEKGITYTYLSKEWIIKLEKNNNIACLVGPRFSINSITSSIIASDKYATYALLKNADIPIIEHQIVFNPKYREGCVSDLNSINDIEDYLTKHKKVVVKANKGSCGTAVYLCDNILEIELCKEEIFKDKESLSICPFYNIEVEYRVICLDDECKLIYGKKPAKGNFKCNLSQGAKILEVENELLKDELKKIAFKVIKEIGLRFASVDIIKLFSGELLVMEVNSTVSINKYSNFVENGRDIAKNIYGDVIEKMLKL